MNLGTDENPAKVVLDTNILVSALVYGGNPEQIVELILDKKLIAFISLPLQTELVEILIKKFNFSTSSIETVEKLIEINFNLVYPTKTINIVRDEDDNRVLEAAVEGKCSYIITGDKELLNLKTFKDIKILNAAQFLQLRRED